MKKILKLYQKNLIFRYTTTFLITILIFSMLLIAEKTIPNGSVKKNIVRSESYYQEYYKQLFGNINTIKNRHTMIDVPGDLAHLSILYLEDNKHPISGFIEMNRDSKLVEKVKYSGSLSNMTIDSDYSRYWHGHLIILKPLLTFFSMKTISALYFILLSIVFLWLLFSLLKHSKLLAIIFTISAISVNFFFVSRCDNFTHVFMISMIASIILIKMYERKSTKYVDLVFFIGGMLTAYFDMLSCGTLPVTLPLFIYVYLHMIRGKKLSLKKIIQYIILWFLGISLTYVAKWIILVIHYHGGFKEHVLEPMKVRIGTGGGRRINVFLESIHLGLNFIFPYGLYIFKFIVIGMAIISFIYLILEKKKRTYYSYFIIICLIPFIRYLILSEHSDYHNYFTYRAFLPVIMFVLLCIYNAFIKIKKVLLKK
ncbi:MAG: hypothetical protein IKE63_05610 [Bacilli bacterium]|nr:hypothetical protein [Bacilli bacterium]